MADSSTAQRVRHSTMNRIGDTELISAAKLFARRALPDAVVKDLRGVAESGFVAGYMFAHGMKFKRITKKKP